MKKIITLLLVLIMTVSAFCFCASADSGVTVYVDGAAVEFDVPPQIINDRTMVPMRAIFEKIGAEVTWDDATKTAISKKDGTTVSITIGEYKLNVNGKDVEIDVPAQIVDSRTLVPVRAISESFNCDVFWQEEYRAVRVVTLKLPEAAKTPDDEILFCTLGTDSPIEISKAKFEFYQAMLPDAPEQEVIDTIRRVEAMYIYHTQKGFPMVEIFNDLLNASLYEMVTSAEYPQFVAENSATDAVMRDYFTKYQFIEFAQYCEEIPEYPDSEIIAYIRENYVWVKHILVEDEALANDLVKQLKDGASFEELVLNHSTDYMDVEKGYVFTHGKMVKEFEDVSYALKDGEISEPVKSTYGYHIIKKYPMSELSDAQLIAQLKEEVTFELLNDNYQKEINAIVETLTVTKK